MPGTVKDLLQRAQEAAKTVAAVQAAAKDVAAQVAASRTPGAPQTPPAPGGA